MKFHGFEQLESLYEVFENSAKMVIGRNAEFNLFKIYEILSGKTIMRFKYKTKYNYWKTIDRDITNIKDNIGELCKVFGNILLEVRSRHHGRKC